MSKRIFTTEEIEALSKNPNVRKASERSISYAKAFKLRALERYKDGMPPSFIFMEAGFDTFVIGRETPKDCLKRWRKTEGTNGRIGFEKHRGRPRKVIDATDADKIRRLQMENAYLKAENDFLTQLRAKRAERYSSRNKGTPSSKG